MLLTAGVLVSLVLAPAASAAGRTYDNAFTCSGNILNIPAPRVWTDNAVPETVYWSPMLYQWLNNAWTPIVQGGWSRTGVTNQGTSTTPWVDLVVNNGAASRTFTIYQPGSFKVANMVIWATGGSSISFAPAAYNTDGYCTFEGSQRPAGSDAAAGEATDSQAVEFHFSDLLFGTATLFLDSIGDQLEVTPDDLTSLS